MTMDEPRTYVRASPRSALPARVSALTAAMAEVLERTSRRSTSPTITPRRNTSRTSSSGRLPPPHVPASRDRRSHARLSGSSDGPAPCAGHARAADPRSAREPRGPRARARGAPEDMGRGGSGDARRFEGVTMNSPQTESLPLHECRSQKPACSFESRLPGIRSDSEPRDHHQVLVYQK